MIRNSETPSPTGATSPGFPSASLSMRAWTRGPRSHFLRCNAGATPLQCRCNAGAIPTDHRGCTGFALGLRREWCEGCPKAVQTRLLASDAEDRLRSASDLGDFLIVLMLLILFRLRARARSGSRYGSTRWRAARHLAPGIRRLPLFIREKAVEPRITPNTQKENDLAWMG